MSDAYNDINKRWNVQCSVAAMLARLAPDATREGLEETPARVAKAWEFWTSGYAMTAADVLKTFEDGALDYDEMLVRKGIPLYSHCEHHMAAIFGTCTIAYIPNGRIVGLSKLDRLVEVFARRLQVQERMTVQIADAFMEHVQPKGCAVYIDARHMCIESRGVQNANSSTVTTALRGVFREQDATRAEFMAAARA